MSSIDRAPLGAETQEHFENQEPAIEVFNTGEQARIADRILKNEDDPLHFRLMELLGFEDYEDVEKGFKEFDFNGQYTIIKVLSTEPNDPDGPLCLLIPDTLSPEATTEYNRHFDLNRYWEFQHGFIDDEDEEEALWYEQILAIPSRFLQHIGTKGN